jgi:hypothetical protein
LEIPRQTRPSISRTASAFGSARLALQPPPRGHLRGAGHGGGQQLDLGLRQPGVGGDRVGDGLHAQPRHPGEPLPYGRLVAQVGLEHQPERALHVGALAVDEVEVCADRVVHPLGVVGGRRHRRAHRADQLGGVQVEQGQVELELAGEVLVEHRLGDPGRSAMSSIAAAW